ncbi:MAG TPA: hypothetical protein VHM31_13795 [Polyangia bacterium]|nr:hypothetical protein [Polyangia bacterium]
MSWRAAIAERRRTIWFVARFLVIFALLRAAYPVVAPSYKAAFGTAANVFLWAAEPGGTVQLRFEPWGVVDGPDRDRMAVLRARDRVFGQEARMRVDVRSFSYRPLATFVALLLAFRWRSRRRAAVVGLAGFTVVAVLTATLTAVGALRFGLGAVLGFGRGPLVQTIYEALTTPAMLYALPVVVFWALFRSTDRPPGAPRRPAVADAG